MPAVMNSNVKRDADVHTQTWVAIFICVSIIEGNCGSYLIKIPQCFYHAHKALSLLFIEVFFLGPAIFFCTLFLFFSGILDFNTLINEKKNNVSVMTCLLSLLIWTLCLFQRDEESFLRKILFLGPFEGLNLVSLMITVKLHESSTI